MTNNSAPETEHDLPPEDVDDDAGSVLGGRRRHPAREAAHHLKGLLAVVIALAILGGGGWFVYTKGRAALAGFGQAPDYTGAGQSAVVVKIPSGTAVTGVGEILLDANVIKSTRSWTKAVADAPEAVKIQAGSYQLKTQLPATSALKMLLDPGRYRVRSQVTVKEGLVLSQQIAALSAGTKIPKAKFTAALKDPADIGLPSYAGRNAEGMLFPQTYEVTDKSDAAALLRQMTGEFASVTESLDLTGRSKAIGVSPYQAVIVASIIEKEVNRPEDRAKVARVIYNRLAKGQNLELDSTVHYATKKYDSLDTTPADREVASPYNTYLHEGLPPGPISAPGKDALNAALNPTPGDWLYFVVVNPETGETKFAATYEEHQRNVTEYQQWCATHKGKCA